MSKNQTKKASKPAGLDTKAVATDLMAMNRADRRKWENRLGVQIRGTNKPYLKPKPNKISTYETDYE